MITQATPRQIHSSEPLPLDQGTVLLTKPHYHHLIIIDDAISRHRQACIKHSTTPKVNGQTLHLLNVMTYVVSASAAITMQTMPVARVFSQLFDELPEVMTSCILWFRRGGMSGWW